MRNVVDVAVYEHFLLLHVSVSILISEKFILTFGSRLPSKYLNAFVKHCGHIYGLDSYVYSIHYLCHISDDVDRFGHLDNFSAFPFENYLGELKRLVKSPHKPIQQIYRRLKEIPFICRHYETDLSRNKISHKFEHNSGPIISNVNCKQFKQIFGKDFIFSINPYSNANSYCLTKYNKVIQIQNILRSNDDNSTIIIGKQFQVYSSFYNYPFSSENLNIFKVTNLSEHVISVQFKDVIAKCMVFPQAPEEDCSIVFPLLHTL